MNFPIPTLDEATRLKLLEPPQGPVEAVLDTDTANEIDDQFALTQAILSPDMIKLEAVYACPFKNHLADTPAEGMEASHEEILRVLERLGVSPEGLVHRGSTAWLPDMETPVESAAVDDLIARARQEREGPLYVMAIGAATNVASAILKAPDILPRIVVVWLGGQPHHWDYANEFNLSGDIAATRVLLRSGCALVQIPCASVAQLLMTTRYEMRALAQPHGAIGEYLTELIEHNLASHGPCASWIIWDVSAVGWLLNPDKLVPTKLVPAPDLEAFEHGYRYQAVSGSHTMRVAQSTHREGILGDLFAKLAQRAAKR